MKDKHVVAGQRRRIPHGRKRTFLVRSGAASGVEIIRRWSSELKLTRLAQASMRIIRCYNANGEKKAKGGVRVRSRRLDRIPALLVASER